MLDPGPKPAPEPEPECITVPVPLREKVAVPAPIQQHCFRSYGTIPCHPFSLPGYLAWFFSFFIGRKSNLSSFFSVVPCCLTLYFYFRPRICWRTRCTWLSSSWSLPYSQNWSWCSPPFFQTGRAGHCLTDRTGAGAPLPSFRQIGLVIALQSELELVLPSLLSDR